MKKYSWMVIAAYFLLFENQAYAQWVQTNGPYGGKVSCFAVSDSTIFAGTYDGVYRSTDNGTSWTEVNSGLPDTPFVLSFAVSGSTVFTGIAGNGGGGVFRITNNGTSWTEVNSGLPDTTYVQSLAVSDGMIFAGISRSGVWRRPLSEIMLKGSTDAHPLREAINQEPFKMGIQSRAGSTLAVDFTIPHSDQVTAKMYNLAGKEMLTLVNKQLIAGSYRYSLETNSFAQGYYMVRLQAGAATFTKLVRIMH